MRRHLRLSAACGARVGAAESFVSFIPLFDGAPGPCTAFPLDSTYAASYDTIGNGLLYHFNVTAKDVKHGLAARGCNVPR